MPPRLRPALAALALLAPGARAALPRSAAAPPAPPQASSADRWAFHLEEQAVQRLWLELSRRHAGEHERDLVLEHASVLSMASPDVLADRTVWIRGGRIEGIAAGPGAAPADARRVDATGKFLIPGLVDMHVHTSTSSSGYLLDLAAGVTRVREMCGFPWMLRRREAERSGALLAPRLHVAGHILNAFPMEMYATVVDTPEHAREVVREQVAAGYELVKVHNRLAPDVYRAIADEAKRLGVRLVGHVPQEISLAEAVENGHHTQEHLKGVILDSNLQLTAEDWLETLHGAAAFVCPTLYTRRSGMVGEEALRWLDTADGMRCVPARDRARWRAAAEKSRGAPATSSFARVWEQSREIFRELLGTDVRILAGTDSGGGYDLMVRGYSLLDELATMVELGMSPLEALRAATVTPAAALDAADELGTVEVGKRADLVLLDADPRKGLATLSRPAGVALGGVWLAREEIEGVLEALAAIYARPAGPAPDAEGRRAFLAEMDAQAAAGMPFMDHHLEELAGLFAAAGDEEGAARVSARRSR